MTISGCENTKKIDNKMFFRFGITDILKRTPRKKEQKEVHLRSLPRKTRAIMRDFDERHETQRDENKQKLFTLVPKLQAIPIHAMATFNTATLKDETVKKILHVACA